MLSRLFGKRNVEKQNQRGDRIALPEESYQLMQYAQDGLPCIAAVNAGLRHFEHRKAFPWHLSLILDLQEFTDNGMPSQEEKKIIDSFCDRLNLDIKAGDNALFLARETWNKTRRLVWMVRNPETAHKYLQGLIESNQYPRQFDYRMEDDPNWEEAEWHFNLIEKA